MLGAGAVPSSAAVNGRRVWYSAWQQCMGGHPTGLLRSGLDDRRRRRVADDKGQRRLRRRGSLPVIASWAS